MSTLFLGLSETSCSASAQLAGYTVVRGKYYKYSGDSVTFAMAKANCSADGGRLAQFDDTITEYQTVVGFFGGTKKL